MSSTPSPRPFAFVPRRPCLVALAISFFLCVSPATFGQADGIQSSAAQQMAALLAEKQARTGAQHKIDSRLLMARAQHADDAWLRAVPHLRIGVVLQPNGHVVVDIEGQVDDALLVKVQAYGGVIVNAHPRFGAMRATVPLDAVELIARLPAVRTVRPADVMMPQMTNTTQGDVAHAADTARVDFNVDGTGVQACAMSDSVDALAAVQASGDLPPTVTVLPGQSGNPGTSEGTALLEIMHDMAPGADLFFATGVGGTAQMAQNILDLAAAGCDVIVDDVLYLSEGVFQDDIIAQAVETVVAAGVVYVTSAGNSGNLTSGTSGVFEGDYAPSALPAPLAGNALSAHDFGGGNVGNELTFDPPVLATLQWADPLDASTNDYDFFLLDPTLSNVLAASTNTQNGTQDPIEFLLSPNDDTGNRLVVTLFNGVERFIHVNTHRGMLDVGTNGQIFGHPGAAGAITVAAVNVATAGGGVFTGGAANPVEPFSSDGPRRIFFNADGTPVAANAQQGHTKGGPTSIVRPKPDVTAADGVSTATPGFDPFFGTSASAPHTAAIAALFEELFPEMDPSDIFDRFASGALDIEAPGFDDVSGHGIIMTDDALNQPIFADGFESGNTSAWTDSVP